MARRRRETYLPSAPAEAPGPRGRRALLRLLPAGTLALLTVAVLAVVAVVVAGRGGTGRAATLQARPVVAVVGDASAAAVATGGGSGDEGLGRGLAATVVSRTEAHARYSPAPSTAVAVAVSTLAAQVPRTARLVLLVAGAADGRADADQLAAGLRRAAAAVDRAAPGAELLAVVPAGASERLRAALQQAAAMAQVRLADPRAQGWLRGHGYVTSAGAITPAGRRALITGLRALVADLLRTTTASPGRPNGGTAAASGDASAPGTVPATAAPSTGGPSAAPPSSTAAADPATSEVPASSAPASSSSGAAPSAAPAPHQGAALPDLPAGSTAYFFGDSWTHGETATRLRGFPFLTAAHFGWAPVVDGKSGSGYIHSTVASSPLFPARAAAVPTSPRPDVVVVEGGLNDRMSDLSGLRAAARTTWQRLAARFPGTPIVVVGPASPTLPVTPQLREVDQLLQQEADAEHLPYISPLQQQWFTPGNIGALIDQSTLHPNDGGHAYYATELERDLVALMGG